MPLVSVIIPVYNASSTLDRCVHSLLTNLFKDFEVIIIDDGSKDNSLHLAQVWAKRDSRIRILIEENLGVSHARNYGITKSKGQYIVFVDSDDFVKETYLSHLIQYTDYDLACVGIDRYNDDNREIENSITHFSDCTFNLSDDKAEKYIIDNDLLAVGYVSAKLYKKAIIDKFGLRFNENIQNHEDHLFYLDYFSHCNQIAINHHADYHWCFHRASQSLSHSKPDYRSLFIAGKEFIDRFDFLFNQFNIKDSSYQHRILNEYGVGSLRAVIYYLILLNKSAPVKS